MVMNRRQHPLLWIAALLAIAAGTLWQQRERTADPVQSRKIDAIVRDAEERAELQKTLDLIARGGPFPFRNDGAVFANRERRLPQQERGYYHEYTVVTPRAQDRGARRVVRGNGGETYYTRDHYRTFARLD